MSTDASSYKPPSSSHSDARRASNSSASSSSTSDSSESHSDLYFNSSDSAAASSSTGDTDTDTSSGDDDDDEEMPGLEPAMEEDDEEDDEDDWHGPYGGGPEVDGHGFNGDDEAEEDDESDGEDWFQDDEEISRRRTGFARLVAGEYRRLYSKRYLKPHHRQRERGPARLPFVLTHVKTHNPETFRSILRVSPSTFDALIARLSDDPVFFNNSQNDQIPVEQQITVVLYRFGHYGNAAGLARVAEWSGFGKGTVLLITRRVLTAILRADFLQTAVRFPTDVEKEAAKQWWRIIHAQPGGTAGCC